MKVVLDTNVLLVCVSRKSQHYWLWREIIDGKLSLAVTNEILAEYEEQLADFYSPRFAQLIMGVLIALPNLDLHTVFFRWQVIVADPDDDKFFDCAIAANADYLVTHDNHFRVVEKLPFPKVNCCTIEQFQKIYMDR